MFYFHVLIKFFSSVVFIVHKEGKLWILITVFVISSIAGGCNTVSIVKKMVHAPTCAINSKTINVKKDSYYLHRQSGEKLPDITLIQNRKQQQHLIRDNVLVSLKNQEFSVQKMNYGTPFVHRKMYGVLLELQNRFTSKLEERELGNIIFVISSAYRTTSDQKRLQKVNRNATKNTSSHSYGASVDIAKLSGKGCTQAIPLFQEVLVEMQAEKILYLCPESNTIHITVRVD